MEIELQQYDLVDFQINTGDVASKEILATDNTYEEAGVKIARDNVLFSRNTSALEKAIEEFANTDGSVAALKTFVESHQELIYFKDTTYGYSRGCWRITKNENDEIEIDATHYATTLEQEDGISYPDYTGTEILDMELQREHELSLMWLILHEHGWKPGFVDPTVDPTSESDMDKIPLANRVDTFEIQSQDIYSFLTQAVSSTYRCIFIFDTENYRVNAYSLSNIGFDTNIFLSFRNIQNQITRSSDRDLYTVFHVAGDEDLRFTEVNFGEDSISDISYFLNTDHFSQELIDKYNYWLEYRQTKRDEYKASSIEYRNKQDIATELYDRVPIDNVEGKQYSTMSLEELEEEKANMIAAKKGLEAFYVDEDGHFDYNAIKNSDDWAWYDSLMNCILSRLFVHRTSSSHSGSTVKDGTTYYKICEIPSGARVEDGSVVRQIDDVEVQWYTEYDHDVCWLWADEYLIKFVIGYDSTVILPGQNIEAIDYVIFIEETKQDGTKEIKQSFDYTKFAQDAGITVDDYRLGQIDIAIFNRRVIDGYYTDDEMSQADKQARTNPKNQMEYLDAIYFDFDTYGYMYGVAELEAQLKSLTNTLNTLETNGYDRSDGTTYEEEAKKKYDKYNAARESCERALAERKQQYDDAVADVNDVLERQAQIKEDVAISNPQFGFSEEEILLLDKYYIHTDYVNNNILITDYFTNEQIVEAEYQLYLDAVDQLYVESHPQYLWSTTQDNLLLMPEFQNWHGQLHVGNFIWVSFRDDYQVKLRISSLTLNPFMIEPDVKIDFTSMVSYKARRNDYADLLASSNASTKNAISTSISSRSNSDKTINIDTALVMKLLNSQVFSGYMNSTNQNASSVAADTVATSNIQVGQITGQQSEFDELFTNYLKSNIIIGRILNVSTATIGDLSAAIINVDFLKATIADIDTLQAGSAFVNYLTTLSTTTAQAVIGQADIGDLATHNATAEQIVLISKDGQKAIAFKNATQQFYDADGNVRVQIGQDGSGDFNFVVVGDDGSTALFNSSGITKDGIPDDTIVNDMIEDSTIQASKVAFNVAIANDDGTISLGTIKDGSGGSFGAAYTLFKDNTEQSFTDIIADVDGLEGKIDLAIIVTEDGQTHEQSISLTQDMIQAITDQFVITGPDGTSTVVRGGNIQTGSIEADMLSADAITSSNYSAPTQATTPFSVAGSKFDLSDGEIITPGFHSDSDGSAKLGNNDYHIDLDGNTGDLSMNVKALSIGGKSGSAQEDTAGLYYDDTNGLVVYQNDESISSITDLTGTVGNVRITGNGMDVYRGQKRVASYGSEVLIGTNVLPEEKSQTIDGFIDSIPKDGKQYYKVALIPNDRRVNRVVSSSDSSPLDWFLNRENYLYVEAYDIVYYYYDNDSSNIRINTNGFQYNNNGDEAFYIGVEQRVAEIGEDTGQNAVEPEEQITQDGIPSGYYKIGNIPPEYIRYTSVIDSNVPETTQTSDSYIGDPEVDKDLNTIYKICVLPAGINVKPDSVVESNNPSSHVQEYIRLQYSEDGTVEKALWATKYKIKYTLYGVKDEDYTFMYASTFHVIQERANNPGYYDLLPYYIGKNFAIYAMLNNNNNDVQVIYRNDSDIVKLDGFYYYLSQGRNKYYDEMVDEGETIFSDDTYTDSTVKDGVTYYKVAQISNRNGRRYYVDSYISTTVKSGTTYYKLAEIPTENPLVPYSIDSDIQWYTVDNGDTYSLWATEYKNVGYTVFTSERLLKNIRAYKRNNDGSGSVDLEVYTERTADYIEFWTTDYGDDTHLLLISFNIAWTNVEMVTGTLKVIDGRIFSNYYDDYLFDIDSGWSDYKFLFQAASDTTIKSESFIEATDIYDKMYYKIYEIPENVIVKSVVRSSDQTLVDYFVQDNGLWAEEYNVIYTIAYIANTNNPYFVFGPNTYSNAEPAGSYSFAVGDHCSAAGSCQAVFGKYNQRKNNNAFIIGNGTSDGVRSNALEVDWFGNVKSSGSLYSESDEITREDILDVVFKKVTITFDANGGLMVISDDPYIVGAAISKKYYEGTIIQSSEYPSVSRSGYTLLGWYTKQEKGKKMDEIIPYVNLTLYAHWQQNT